MDLSGKYERSQPERLPVSSTDFAANHVGDCQKSAPARPATQEFRFDGRIDGPDCVGDDCHLALPFQKSVDRSAYTIIRRDTVNDKGRLIPAISRDQFA